jgi:hypothetical protein
VAFSQPRALPFGLDGRAWERCRPPFTEVASGRERVVAGGVVMDGGGSGDELAVAVTMFTHVVTATPGSVLTDRCFLKGYGYLV